MAPCLLGAVCLLRRALSRRFLQETVPGYHGPVNGVMTPLHPRDRRPLAERFRLALADDGTGLDDLAAAEPVDRRDAVLSLLAVNDLHTAPIDRLQGAERFQHHPAVASLKRRLDDRFLSDLEARDVDVDWQLPEGAPAAMRALGALGLVPDVYRWLSDEASPTEVVAFLAYEGGPDGGFDDLVAACQIGLSGSAKVELAQNYWDEMGGGQLDLVHTELHHKLASALGLPDLDRDDQPLEGLERAALASVLATNRRLQPEMVGALGLLELQAGPRCRKVVRALERIGASEEARHFYVEHANVDPRHGKDWVDKAVAPLATDPRWDAGIIRGARWRSLVNAAFFEAVHQRFVPAAAALAS